MIRTTLFLRFLVVISALCLGACGDDDTSTDANSPSGETESGEGGTDESPSGEEGSDDSATAAAVSAANSFLATLDDPESAVFERDASLMAGSWSNLPEAGFDDRKGARMGDLDADQFAAAMAVLEAVLSDRGYEQLVAILRADDYLGENSGGGGGGPGGGGAGWSSENYYLAFYGEPATDTPWTLQFGGHHLALHVTLGGGALSLSPLFLGVEPTSFTYEGTDYAPMEGEHTAVFDLLAALSDEELATATSAQGVGELVMGAQSDEGFPDEGGLAVADLSAALQGQVRDLIAQWVEDADAELAADLMAVYEDQLGETAILFSGSTDADEESYLRIHGPRIWIEYQNETGVGTGDVHYHSVYRDKTLDYGAGF